MADLPIAEYGMVQLEPGPETFCSQRVGSDQAVLVHMRFAPRGTGFVVPGAGWTAILLPQPRETTYRVNGATIDGNALFVISSALGCQAIGMRRDNLDCGLHTDRLIVSIAAILGVDPDPSLLPDMQLNAPKPAIIALRRKLETLLERQSGPLTAATEACLYDAVAALIARYGPTASVIRGDAKSNRAILHNVATLARQSAFTPTLTQICLATGVSRTRLFDCFASELGIAPGQFLIHQRLVSVREALTGRGQPGRSVKDVMLAHGIRNGGRFAASYRDFYGENPSDTLARASTGGDAQV